MHYGEGLEFQTLESAWILKARLGIIELIVVVSWISRQSYQQLAGGIWKSNCKSVGLCLWVFCCLERYSEQVSWNPQTFAHFYPSKVESSSQPTWKRAS